MRSLKINGSRVKVFQEKDIIEKLGRTKEDWKLVKTYQKKFWQLLQDNDGFCVNARVLWEELGRPYTKYADWIKKKVLKRRWDKEIDYIAKSIKIDLVNDGYKKVDTHFFTVEMAKHVAMMENTEEGKVVRDYFILMDKCVREYEKWVEIREPQKQGDNLMKDTIYKNYIKTKGRKPNNYTYMNEHDMLNTALTGMKAKELRDYLSMEDKNTRDHLTTKVNDALSRLQFLNTSLISSNIDKDDRKEIILNTVESQFNDIKREIEKIHKIKAS